MTYVRFSRNPKSLDISVCDACVCTVRWERKKDKLEKRTREGRREGENENEKGERI